MQLLRLAVIIAAAFVFIQCKQTGQIWNFTISNGLSIAEKEALIQRDRTLLIVYRIRVNRAEIVHIYALTRPRVQLVRICFFSGRADLFCYGNILWCGIQYISVRCLGFFQTIDSVVFQGFIFAKHGKAGIVCFRSMHCTGGLCFPLLVCCVVNRFLYSKHSMCQRLGCVVFVQLFYFENRAVLCRCRGFYMVLNSGVFNFCNIVVVTEPICRVIDGNRRVRRRIQRCLVGNCIFLIVWNCQRHFFSATGRLNFWRKICNDCTIFVRNLYGARIKTQRTLHFVYQGNGIGILEQIFTQCIDCNGKRQFAVHNIRFCFGNRSMTYRSNCAACGNRLAGLISNRQGIDKFF